jgi:hypothetical protein
MRSDGRTYRVVSVRVLLGVGVQRRVAGLLQRRLTGTDRNDASAQEAHEAYVRIHLAEVGRTEVHFAFESEPGGRAGECNAVLAGARLGDQLPLAHSSCEEREPRTVVDLVRAVSSSSAGPKCSGQWLPPKLP